MNKNENRNTIVRDSNMELARIVAIFMVLVVHACFGSLGWPTSTELVEVPGFTVGKLAVESLSIICVNLFVLISGWYGINFRFKKLASLLFQVFYFSVLGYVILVLLGGEQHIGIKGLASVFMLTGDYWFMKSYIILMLFSPVLNNFIEISSRKQLFSVTIMLFVFQTVYGWTDTAMDFRLGYSALSFMILYLLARYIRLYADKVRNIPKSVFLELYIVISFMTVAIASFALKNFIGIDSMIYVFAYNNPFTVLASVCVLIFFSKLDIKCRWVNILAGSCLSVYLLHTNRFLFSRYCEVVRQIYYNGSSVISSIGMIFCFLLLILAVSVLLDQPRKMIWSLIERIKVTGFHSVM